MPSRQERRRAERDAAKRDAAKRAPAQSGAAGARGAADAGENVNVNVNPGGDWQGLTLVHFSAQLEHFVWDRGCAQGLCTP
jgi:hypothetical protein